MATTPETLLGEESETSTITITEVDEPSVRPHSPTLILELQRPTTETNGPRVRWTEGTIDNEYLNKKKSKCCCVYTKPHDSRVKDDDNEKTSGVDEYGNCSHCRFHTESDYVAKPEDRQPKIQLKIADPKTS